MKSPAGPFSVILVHVQSFREFLSDLYNLILVNFYGVMLLPFIT